MNDDVAELHAELRRLRAELEQIGAKARLAEDYVAI